MQHIEDTEQMYLFQWAELNSGKFPELDMLFHIPNGGKRDKREAARFKKMGVKAGVPDLFLPLARGRYHGMFIEMKSPTGKRSGKQIEWMEKLTDNDYKAIVCYGWEEAALALRNYIIGEEKKSLYD